MGAAQRGHIWASTPPYVLKWRECNKHPAQQRNVLMGASAQHVGAEGRLTKRKTRGIAHDWRTGSVNCFKYRPEF